MLPLHLFSDQVEGVEGGKKPRSPTLTISERQSVATRKTTKGGSKKLTDGADTDPFRQRLIDLKAWGAVALDTISNLCQGTHERDRELAELTRARHHLARLMRELPIVSNRTYSTARGRKSVSSHLDLSALPPEARAHVETFIAEAAASLLGIPEPPPPLADDA